MRVLQFILSVLLLVLSLASCKQTAVKQPGARVLPFYQTPDFTPQWFEEVDTTKIKIHTIPAFAFVNQEGKRVTEENFHGKIYIVNFFFTSCPGICKRLTAQLSLVQTAFALDTNVLLLSHSVTPETDSVPKLQLYAKANGVNPDKWSMVTGNRAAIYQLARESYFADEDMGEKKSAADFLHTENVLLIDTHKRIRGVYKGTSVKEMNELIADIKLLETEK
ncbi:MAG: hypothetical protein RLZZ28_672 [Bacteroidota bacterium]|jgi:protein SCO1/2